MILPFFSFINKIYNIKNIIISYKICNGHHRLAQSVEHEILNPGVVGLSFEPPHVGRKRLLLLLLQKKKNKQFSVHFFPGSPHTFNIPTVFLQFYHRKNKTLYYIPRFIKYCLYSY